GAGGIATSASGGSAGVPVDIGGSTAQGGKSAAGSRGGSSAGPARQGGEGGTPYPRTAHYVGPPWKHAQPRPPTHPPLPNDRPRHFSRSRARHARAHGRCLRHVHTPRHP